MKVRRLFLALAGASALALTFGADAVRAGGLPWITHFEKLDLVIENFAWGHYRSQITLLADGSVRVKPNGGGAEIDAKATASEMKRVKAAWVKAKLGMGKTQIPGMVPDGSVFTLGYDFGGAAFQVHKVVSGELSGFTLELELKHLRSKALVDALSAIETRLEKQGEEKSIEGTIGTKGADTTLHFWNGTPNPGIDYTVTNAPWKAFLAKHAKDRQALVHGVVVGETIEVDQVNGYALAATTLLSQAEGGKKLAKVKKDAPLEITGVSANGAHVEVRLANGKEGWLATKDVQVGNQFIHYMAPAPQAGNTQGLSGAVGGSGHP